MTIHEFLQGDKFALLAGVELLETGNGYAKARIAHQARTFKWWRRMSRWGDLHVGGSGFRRGD